MSLGGAWDWRFGGWQAARRRGGSIIESMVIDMIEAQVCTLQQVRQVLAGTQAMEFQAVADDQGRYAWIESVLQRFEYRRLPRADRGPVLAYLQRLSGYSRAQTTRLVSRWDAGKPLVMAAETDPMELAAQKPSNVWTSTVDFGDENLKKEWLLQQKYSLLLNHWVVLNH